MTTRPVDGRVLHPAVRRSQYQGWEWPWSFATFLGNSLAHGVASSPRPGAVTLWTWVASASGHPARHSSRLSSLPTAAPPSPFPDAGDGTEASGGPSRKPLPHSDPCWSERKLLWKELRKQGKVLPIPWGRNSPGGTCLAGRATVT